MTSSDGKTVKLGFYAVTECTPEEWETTVFQCQKLQKEGLNILDCQVAETLRIGETPPPPSSSLDTSLKPLPWW